MSRDMEVSLILVDMGVHEIVFLPRLPRGKPFGSLAGVVSAERLNRISPLSTAMLKTAWRFRCLVLNPTG